MNTAISMSGTHSLTEFHVEFLASLGIETTPVLTTEQLTAKVSTATKAIETLLDPLNKVIATEMLEQLKSSFAFSH